MDGRPADDRFDDLIDAHAEDAFEFLEALVRADSTVGREAEALDVFASQFETIGLAPEAVDVPHDIGADPCAGVPQVAYDDRHDVIARLAGHEAAPSLLLNGHIDVVPPGDVTQWSAPPFRPVRRDGWLYGRGSGDMKAGFAMGWLALHAVRTRRPRGAARRPRRAGGDRGGVHRERHPCRLPRRAPGRRRRVARTDRPRPAPRRHRRAVVRGRTARQRRPRQRRRPLGERPRGRHRPRHRSGRVSATTQHRRRRPGLRHGRPPLQPQRRHAHGRRLAVERSLAGAARRALRVPPAVDDRRGRRVVRRGRRRRRGGDSDAAAAPAVRPSERLPGAWLRHRSPARARRAPSRPPTSGRTAHRLRGTGWVRPPTPASTSTSSTSPPSATGRERSTSTASTSTSSCARSSTAPRPSSASSTTSTGSPA